MRFTHRCLVIPALCLGALVPTASAQVSPLTGQDAPSVVCFAEGTTPDYVERISDIVNAQNQVFAGTADYYQANQRWSGAQGTPRTLTWSFVPDGTVITAAVPGETNSGSSLFAQMDSAFRGAGQFDALVLCAGGALVAHVLAVLIKARTVLRFRGFFDFDSRQAVAGLPVRPDPASGIESLALR